MAQQACHDHGDDTPGLLTQLFRLAAGRHPSPAELDAMRDLHAKQLQRFVADPERTQKWLTVGDIPPDPTIPPARLAAAASVANMLLNYDGCMTKR